MFPGANSVLRFAVSPDGQHIAFLSDLPAKRDAIWIRSLNALDATLIRGTEALPDVGRAGGLQQPFWSPDSRSIAFFDEHGGKLKTVDIHGGAVETVCEQLPGNQYGGSWNAGGIMLVATIATNGIQRIRAKGGAPERVTTLDTSRRELSHLWPQFLPDGRHFLYHVQTARPAPSSIYVGSIDATDRKRLVDSDYMGQFCATESAALCARHVAGVADHGPRDVRTDGGTELPGRIDHGHPQRSGRDLGFEHGRARLRGGPGRHARAAKSPGAIGPARRWNRSVQPLGAWD